MRRLLALVLVGSRIFAAGLPNPFSPRSWGIALPGAETPQNVDFRANISYSSEDDKVHRLDLYIPRERTNFPIVVFLHGGDWRIGDRSQYRGLGNRLARAGVAVAIPSFRLMGVASNAHPAQVQDAAEAFAWLHRHARDFGGDPQRIFVTGHSSGGHLASLLALDESYLRQQGLSTSDIRGVISVSGVYNVERLFTFRASGNKKLASPIRHVRSGAPKFLVAYSQWDFVTLPGQARKFAEALRRSGNEVELLRIPGDNHVNEILHVTKERGPLIDALLRFVNQR